MIEGLYKIFQDKWQDFQTFWIFSDPHFNDKDLEKEIKRPRAQEMIEKINSKVGKKDVFICLGDVGDVDCVRQIKGYKILVMGNHDLGRTNYERVIKYLTFDKSKYSKEEIRQKVMLDYPGWKMSISESHDLTRAPFYFWEVKMDNCLFDEVYEGPLMIGEKLILSHEPLDISWAMNIHGHCHDPQHINDNYHFNVCSDVIDYAPINFNQFMKQGHLSKIKTIHREIINKAIIRKRKRKG